MLTSTQRNEAGSTECVASASGTCLVSLRILRRSHEPTALSSDSNDGEPKTELYQTLAVIVPRRRRRIQDLQ